MTAHAAACAAWFLLHLLIAGVWRPVLAARLGENGFRGLFSALSALSLGAMIWTYTQAPYAQLWPPGPA
ncbi:MAG: NnrU family protein, partial [Nevskiales bacterium]